MKWSEYFSLAAVFISFFSSYCANYEIAAESKSSRNSVCSNIFLVNLDLRCSLESINCATFNPWWFS